MYKSYEPPISQWELDAIEEGRKYLEELKKENLAKALETDVNASKDN